MDSTDSALVTIALPFLLGLVVSATLVPLCRQAALRLGYIVPATDRPAGARPKALFGGVGIVLTLFGCAAAIGALTTVSVLLACSAVLFAIGLASDLFTVRPSTKLVAVIAVASVFLFFGYRLHWSPSLTLDSIVTLLWIVGITGAFHLLDNMDGLCGGTALIAGTAFMLTLLPLPPGAAPLQSQYLAVLLGAIAGFLIYNIHPASIVLGEAGSLVIGLQMSALTLQIAPGRGSDLVSIIAVPVLLLLIPIADAVLVAISRLTSGSEAVAHEGSTTSRRLVAMGMSERSAVSLLWMLSAMSGLIGVIADRNQQVSGLFAAMFTIGVTLFVVYLARVRVHENVDPERLPATIVPLGFDLGYRRRVAEVMLDLMLVAVAYYGAHRLLFTTAEWAEEFDSFFRSFPVVLAAQTIALFAVGAYRGVWRYFSLSDGVTSAKGVFLGVVTSQVAILYLQPSERQPPALFVVYAMLLLLLLVGSRASFRLISESIQRQRQTGRRLLIYGADDAGATVVRHLLTDARSAYRIVGFIDDDVGKRNIRVHGYRVIGGYDHLVGMVMAGEVDAVAITHDSPAIENLAWLCASHGVTVYRLGIDWREVPAVGAVAAGAAVALRPAAEPRIVRFTDGRRQRELSATAGTASPAVPEGQPQPIRVAHIITRLILGGAQENTLYTAIGQHRDPRFEVTLVCGVDEAGEGNMFGEARRAGLNVVVLPSLVREIRFFTDIKALVQLHRFLKKGAYTIVHTHSSKAGVVGRIAARTAGVPVVMHTIHGVAFHEFQSRWKNWIYILLERLCAPLSDRIISVGQRLSDAALAQRIGRPAQHVTIFSGIDLELFLSVRDRLAVADAKRRAGIPPEAPVVGKVARLFPLKGHEQFIEVAERISREVPGTYFLLVGDGPLRDELRADAERRGIGERVVMVGRVPPEQVPEYMQAMDVVVHTSLREGIARVLPQAGAVGKPVVTFHLDGAPEVVRDGISGYLVPPLDTGAVADRTVELLRDPDKRRVFGEAGRAFAAEHFSVERMVERINTICVDLASGAVRRQ